MQVAAPAPAPPPTTTTIERDIILLKISNNYVPCPSSDSRGKGGRRALAVFVKLQQHVFVVHLDIQLSLFAVIRLVGGEGCWIFVCMHVKSVSPALRPFQLHSSKALLHYCVSLH